MDYSFAFPDWHRELACGFNLLLLGYGSKETVISDFLESVPSCYDRVHFLGYHPMASKALKNLVHRLKLDQCKNKTNPTIYIAVQCIDAPGLKECQKQLSMIAGNTNVRMIASCDSIHTPEQWSHSVVANFKFVRHVVHTWEPYVREVKTSGSFVTDIKETSQVVCVSHVLNVLSERSRKCFEILASCGLQSKQSLVLKCRMEFLCSDERGFDSLVAEFFDHKFLCSKYVDGTEYLEIPLSKDIIDCILEKIRQD